MVGYTAPLNSWAGPVVLWGFALWAARRPLSDWRLGVTRLTKWLFVGFCVAAGAALIAVYHT